MISCYSTWCPVCIVFVHEEVYDELCHVLSCSREDFTTILELPEGSHEYKFFVDGQWVHDSGEVCVH